MTKDELEILAQTSAEHDYYYTLLLYFLHKVKKGRYISLKNIAKAHNATLSKTRKAALWLSYNIHDEIMIDVKIYRYVESLKVQNK